MADAGGGSFHGAEDRVVGPGLGDAFVAYVAFLEFEVEGDCVAFVEVMGGMRYQAVVLPKANVAFPEREGAP